jgi:hypothetical protein
VDLSKASWFKSSYSQGENTACVEVAFAWRKSSYSGGENTACVEVAFTSPAVAVRDSKDPSGPHFAVDASAWLSFLSTVTTAVTRTE